MSRAPLWTAAQPSKGSRTVSRVLSLPVGEGGHHYSRTAVTRRLKQPTREQGRADPCAPLFGFAPDGVFLALRVATQPGGLLPHRFTLTGQRPAVCFLWHFPGIAPSGRYPASCPAEPGLSSPVTRGDGPSDSRPEYNGYWRKKRLLFPRPLWRAVGFLWRKGILVPMGNRAAQDEQAVSRTFLTLRGDRGSSGLGPCAGDRPADRGFCTWPS